MPAGCCSPGTARGHRLRTCYDDLGRPVEVWLRDHDGETAEILVGRTVYGDGLPDAAAHNLRGTVAEAFDSAGVVTNREYDFKGNLLLASRQFVTDVVGTVDWSAEPALDPEVFTSATSFDALNRTTQLVAPQVAGEAATVMVVQPQTNQAGLLETLDAWTHLTEPPTARLDPSTADLHLVTGVEYDAHGQRAEIAFGNGTSTTYTHDPETMRLRRLTTMRGTTALQDLSYTPDPTGHTTDMRDGAQQTLFFRSRQVDPGADYVYDALYRMVQSTGREHAGGGSAGGQPRGPVPPPWLALPSIEDGAALTRYVERYAYDATGNIVELRHRALAAGRSGWTRTYSYDEPSALQPDRHGNRLSRTTVGDGQREPYRYDANGNMTSMPHLPRLDWDEQDRLHAVSAQHVRHGPDPETTYYGYDALGQRVRKVTLRHGRRVRERLYLGGFEVQRRYASDGFTVEVERLTLHASDDRQRVALVERRTVGHDKGAAELVRYQYVDQVGSSILELDAGGRIITYEENLAYGAPSYQAVRRRTETPKPVPFTGKERDDETGLSCFGQRLLRHVAGPVDEPRPSRPSRRRQPLRLLARRPDRTLRSQRAGVDAAPARGAGAGVPAGGARDTG